MPRTKKAKRSTRPTGGGKDIEVKEMKKKQATCPHCKSLKSHKVNFSYPNGNICMTCKSCQRNFVQRVMT